MNAKQKVGTYFTAGELRLTAAPPEAVVAMTALVGAFLDPLRRRLNRAINVTSAYRDPERNEAAGGADGSQHTKGEAVDFKVNGYNGESLAREILSTGLVFDQLIWYAPERGGHVHVSFTTSRANRRQTLHAPASGGYVPWSARTTSPSV